MRLLGRERLERLCSQSEKARKWVQSWMAELLDAQWKTSSDVRRQFPNVRCNGECMFVFPVHSCNCAVSVLVAFPQAVAVIQEMKVTDES